MSVLTGPRRERRRVLHNGVPRWGEVEGDRLRLDGGPAVALDALPPLPPCTPQSIICPHLTYRSRGFESRGVPQPTAHPTYFMKPVTALAAHGAVVERPEGCQYLNYEGEFAAVIGRPTRDVTPEEAWSSIAGFTPVLDLGLHDFRDTDSGSMLRVKGMDGFCPVGPGLVSGVDPRASRLQTFVNGECVQDAQVGEELIWGPEYLIADLARHITLMPGDLVLTGTPCHSRSVAPGDEISLSISQLGTLTVTVTARPAPRAEAGHLPQDSEEARRVALGNDARVPDALREALQRARAKRRSPGGQA
ncbi:MAG: fumarylacetoacetate hydrolase family protein [Pseudomonadales bacterium]